MKNIIAVIFTQYSPNGRKSYIQMTTEQKKPANQHACEEFPCDPPFRVIRFNNPTNFLAVPLGMKKDLRQSVF